MGPVCEDVDALVAELIGREGFAETDVSGVVAVLVFLRVSVCRRSS